MPFSALFGLNIMIWGIIGFFSFEFSIPRFCITCLNCLIGYLIIIRKNEISVNGFYENITSLPAIILGGILFKTTPLLHTWSIEVQLVFVIGTLIAIYSFLYLGKSFSLRPALQEIISKGPYKIVRHPAYFGEYLMMVACCMASDNIYAFIGLVFLFIFQVIRINSEEKILSQSKTYQLYQQKTKWKLIPLVW